MALILYTVVEFVDALGDERVRPSLLSYYIYIGNF